MAPPLGRTLRRWPAGTLHRRFPGHCRRQLGSSARRLCCRASPAPGCRPMRGFRPGRHLPGECLTPDARAAARRPRAHDWPTRRGTSTSPAELTSTAQVMSSWTRTGLAAPRKRRATDPRQPGDPETGPFPPTRSDSDWTHEASAPAAPKHESASGADSYAHAARVDPDSHGTGPTSESRNFDPRGTSPPGPTTSTGCTARITPCSTDPASTPKRTHV